MTAFAPAPRLVLADRVFARSLPLDVVLVVAGAALTAVFAQIAVPFIPVPMTMQTLAVLLVASTLGAMRATLAMTVYALAGAIGLPVFSDYASGIGVIVGPTGGYIIGFVASAALVGWLAERSWDRKVLKALASFLAGTVVVFAFGVPWLALYYVAAGPAVWADALGYDSVLVASLDTGLVRFILGGVVKAAIAALLLPLAWWGAERIERRRADAESVDG